MSLNVYQTVVLYKHFKALRLNGRGTSTEDFIYFEGAPPHCGKLDIYEVVIETVLLI